MPWRLIQFIAIFAVFLLFIVFNMDNRSDVSLGFRTFANIPVFVTAFFAFIAGMALSLPFVVAMKAKKGRGPKPAKKDGPKTAADRREGAGGAEAGKGEPAPAEMKDFGID